MKPAAASILLLVALWPGPARADDPARPAGACMPIGLTASGEIVFPWECRETIEKARGPVALARPAAEGGELAGGAPAKAEQTVGVVSTASAAAPDRVASAVADPSAPAETSKRGGRKRKDAAKQTETAPPKPPKDLRDARASRDADRTPPSRPPLALVPPQPSGAAAPAVPLR